MTVACVLRSGGDYDAAYVERLADGVARYLPDADLVCLTDTDLTAIRSESLIHDWPGWWSKVELFRPDLFDGPVAYFDLDTVLVGSLEFLTGYDGDFATLRDFWSPAVQASGVMLFDGSNPPPIYEIALYEGLPLRGRFDHWWNQHVTADTLQDLYPGRIVSYKEHCKAGLPPDARVVCFHGKPRPVDLQLDHWASEAWRGVA